MSQKLPPALLLRCGCEIRFDEDTVPVCPTHGAVGIARTLRMPPPRIRGVASGPHVKTEDLSPFMGRLAGSPPQES